MPPATIRDVARQAGVSVATVSRVINHSPLVNEPTRQRVLQAIEELGYSPNIVARRLSKGRTYTIAVMMPLFLPSFVERLRGVRYGLGSSHYDLILYNIETPEQRDEHYANLTRRSWVDGVILISLPPTHQESQEFIKAGIPVALVDAWHPDLGGVFVDDVAGGYMATQHLLELGHQRVAFLSDYLETPFNYVSMKRRFTGYLQALDEGNISFRPEYHQQGLHGRAEACLMAHRLFELPEPPTAIFAASDTQAIGVLDAAAERGLRVPEDLSIVGYDEIRDAAYVNLTTIRQPLFESGQAGAEILLRSLDPAQKPERPEEIELPLELVVRKTSGPAPNHPPVRHIRDSKKSPTS